MNDGDLNLSNNSGFGASGASQGTTVASGASLKVGSLVTDSPEPLTIAGTGYSGYGALFFNGGGKFSGTVALSADATIRVVSGTTGEISGVISGSSTLTKSDSGTLTLSGANIYTGATSVSGGSIAVSNASSLGTTAAATSVTSGAAIKVSGGVTIAEALTISGDGASSAGALQNTSGTNVWSGAITLGAASEIQIDTGTTLTMSGGISGTNTNLTIDGVGTSTVSEIGRAHV